MKKRFITFVVVGATVLSIGIAVASQDPTNEVTVTADETPVIAEQNVEGQEYIVQEDGTITIYLK